MRVTGGITPSTLALALCALLLPCVREIREATKALNPIKTKLRAFEGQKVSVPGGRVAIGVSKEAVWRALLCRLRTRTS